MWHVNTFTYSCKIPHITVCVFILYNDNIWRSNLPGIASSVGVTSELFLDAVDVDMKRVVWVTWTVPEVSILDVSTVVVAGIDCVVFALVSTVGLTGKVWVFVLAVVIVVWTRQSVAVDTSVVLFSLVVMSGAEVEALVDVKWLETVRKTLNVKYKKFSNPSTIIGHRHR